MSYGRPFVIDLDIKILYKELLPFEIFFPKVEKNDKKPSKIINDKRQDTLLLGYNYPEVGDCGAALWGGCD